MLSYHRVWVTLMTVREPENQTSELKAVSGERVPEGGVVESAQKGGRVGRKGNL